MHHKTTGVSGLVEKFKVPKYGKTSYTAKNADTCCPYHIDSRSINNKYTAVPHYRHSGFGILPLWKE
jgi:hypothetical protein